MIPTAWLDHWKQAEGRKQEGPLEEIWPDRRRQRAELQCLGHRQRAEVQCLGHRTSSAQRTLYPLMQSVPLSAADSPHLGKMVAGESIALSMRKAIK